MELGSIATSTVLETEGVWHPVQDGFEIKIARIGNPAYSLAMQALTLKPSAGNFNGEKQTITDDELAAILASTVIVDWKGLTENKKEVKYSVKKAKEILLDPRYQDLRRWVIRMASDATNYREEVINEAMGKSQSTSDGDSSGEVMQSS